MWSIALWLMFSENAFLEGDRLQQVATVAALSTSIELAPSVQTESIDAVTLHQQGVQAFQQGDFLQAIVIYEQALDYLSAASVPTTTDRDLLIASLYSQLGHTYANIGEYDTALSMLDKSEKRYLTLNSSLGSAEVAIYRSFVYRRQGNYSSATTQLATAQALLDRNENHHEHSTEKRFLPKWQKSLQGEALHNLAAVKAAIGENETAITLNQQAVFIWQTLEPSDSYPLRQDFHIGRSLNNLGGIYYTQGNFAEAQRLYEQALTIARRIGNRASEGRILTNLGLLDRQAGDYQQAKRHYQAALSALNEIGDQASASSTYNSLGIVHTALGNTAAARESYQRGLAIAQEIGDRPQLGNLRDSLGGLYYRQSQYGKAIAAFEQALSLHREVGNPRGEASTLHNLAGTYAALGRYTTALDYLEQALALNDPTSTVGVLAAQGGIYQQLGRFPEALEATQKGLELANVSGSQAARSQLLDRLGNIYTDLNQIEAATLAYEQALRLARDSEELSATGRSLNSLATLAVRQEDYPQARAHLQSALADFRQVGDRAGESIILSNLGKLYEAEEQPALAIVFYKQAILQHEAIRGNLRSLPNELQQSYLTSITPTYRLLADLLLQQDRVLEAQQIIDLLKVQEVDDYLQGIRGDAEVKGEVATLAVEDTLWEAYEDLNERAIAISQELATLRQLERPLTPEETSRKAKLDEQQRQIVRQFREFSRRDDVVNYVQALTRTAQEQSLSLSRLQDLSQNLNHLEEPAVLLYPFILEDRLELVLVAPGVPPVHHTVEVDRSTLNRAIQEFRHALISPERDPLPAAQQLYAWLISPVESQLSQAQAKTILYAPDGALRYVPLAALHSGDRWLIEDFRINNITAASIDDLNSKPPSSQRILAGAFSDAGTRYEVQGGDRTFGFNGLPYAGKEVEALQALQPESTVYFNPDFSKSNLLPNMDDYPIVHLATHASFLPGSPLDSFVLLGNGETITLQEVQDEWFFGNLDLVVLSACQTGLSSLGETGEEILGFGYLMQNAGVNAAMASLWAVDDGGTQTLMDAFYTSLLQNKVSKAEALRQAQLALIGSEVGTLTATRGGLARVTRNNETENQRWNRLSHPYYWSPFILIGNGL